jgi:hypothetical protein
MYKKHRKGWGGGPLRLVTIYDSIKLYGAVAWVTSRISCSEIEIAQRQRNKLNFSGCVVFFVVTGDGEEVKPRSQRERERA